MFEDLEGQLSAEWEAERAVLEAESERLRISKLTLLTRLRLLHNADAPVTIRLAGGERQTGRLRAVGADWIAVQTRDLTTVLIVPIAALTGIETHHGALLAALDDGQVLADGMRAQMTLGFLMRDLARRRTPLRIFIDDGEQLHGTIDRAGGDHLDLAVHDAGEPRSAAAVRAFRIIPFTAVRWLSMPGASF